MSWYRWIFVVAILGGGVSAHGICDLSSARVDFTTSDGRRGYQIDQNKVAQLRAACEERERAERLADLERMARENPDMPIEGSSTRAAQTCKTVAVMQGTLEVCELAPGAGGRQGYVYLLNGQEYDGRVRHNRDGSYTLTSDEALKQDLSPRRYRGPQLPAQFNCQNRGEEFQCLVCSCFFEARGQSYPERVRVGRTKFSRVLNHRFPNDVCSVTHQRGGARRVPQYSWVSEHSSNKIFQTVGGETKLPVNVLLGVGSPDLNTIEKEAYRGCVQASAEALHYRNSYFASYYYTKSLEGQRAWINTCSANTSHLSGNLIEGVEDSQGESIVFAHNFRRICEKDEEYLLSIDQSPQAPYRSPLPRMRPENLDTSSRSVE